MSETEPKKWKPGTSDEVWKIHICSRDASRAEDIASGLSYIISETVTHGFESHLSTISQFTGEQIAKALKDYRDSSLDSIKKGLRKQDA